MRLNLVIACCLLLIPGALVAEAPLMEFAERSFSAQDPALPGGEHYYERTVEALAGDRVEITMAALELSPYLIVVGPDDSVVAETGEGARPDRVDLVLNAPREGAYRVIATTAEAGETGTYLLGVSHLGGATQAEGNPRLLRGRVSKLDAGADGGRVHQVPVEAGEELVVAHRSEDYDAFLTVTTPDGRVLENDDGGSGTDSQLSVTINQDGVLTCQLGTFGDGGTGSFTLEVSGGETSPETDVLAQLGAERIRGNLAGGAAASAHRYAFRIEEARRVALLARWYGFDGYLELHTAQDVEVASNDDMGGTDWSALRVDLEPGIYEVVLRPYNEEAAGGRYELSAVGTGDLLRVGGTVTVVDSLAAGDDALASGELADVHEMIARAGETWTVDVSATGFAPHVLILGPDDLRKEGGDYPAADRARLGLEIPTTGVYRVVVTSREPGQSGDYRLLYGPSQAVIEHPLLDVRREAEF